MHQLRLERLELFARLLFVQLERLCRLVLSPLAPCGLHLIRLQPCAQLAARRLRLLAKPRLLRQLRLQLCHPILRLRRALIRLTSFESHRSRLLPHLPQEPGRLRLGRIARRFHALQRLPGRLDRHMALFTLLGERIPHALQLLMQLGRDTEALTLSGLPERAFLRHTRLGHVHAAAARALRRITRSARLCRTRPQLACLAMVRSLRCRARIALLTQARASALKLTDQRLVRRQGLLQRLLLLRCRHHLLRWCWSFLRSHGLRCHLARCHLLGPRCARAGTVAGTALLGCHHRRRLASGVDAAVGMLDGCWLHWLVVHLVRKGLRFAHHDLCCRLLNRRGRR